MKRALLTGFLLLGVTGILQGAQAGRPFSAQTSATSAQSLKNEIAELINLAQTLGADKAFFDEQLTAAGDGVAQLQGLKAMVQDTIVELDEGSREREKAKKERMAHESRTREIADLVSQIEKRLRIAPKSDVVDLVRQEYSANRNDPVALRNVLEMLEEATKPAEPPVKIEPARVPPAAQAATARVELGAGAGAGAAAVVSSEHASAEAIRKQMRVYVKQAQKYADEVQGIISRSYTGTERYMNARWAAEQVNTYAGHIERFAQEYDALTDRDVIARFSEPSQSWSQGEKERFEKAMKTIKKNVEKIRTWKRDGTWPTASTTLGGW